MHPKIFPPIEIASGNRIDTTNAFLDSFSANLGGKIAPESIELTDVEQSSFFDAICQDF